VEVGQITEQGTLVRVKCAAPWTWSLADRRLDPAPDTKVTGDSIRQELFRTLLCNPEGKVRSSVSYVKPQAAFAGFEDFRQELSRTVKDAIWTRIVHRERRVRGDRLDRELQSYPQRSIPDAID
jgi:hypothetical protein